ncbi:MAG: hypothetical protein ACLFPD_05845 [Desulfosudaceae bacterium]
MVSKDRVLAADKPGPEKTAAAQHLPPAGPQGIGMFVAPTWLCSFREISVDILGWEYACQFSN